MIATLGTLTLARGEKFNESPDKLKINGQKLIQIEGTLRSEHAQVYDRGNARTSITFEVTRVHPTAQAAYEFMLDHLVQASTATGNLELITEPDTKTFILEGATLRMTQCSTAGLRSTHCYEIIGSRLMAKT